MGALDLSIAWGDDVLFARHFSSAREVIVGDEGAVDFAIDAATLGVARLPIARVEGREIVVTVPRGTLVDFAGVSSRAFRQEQERRTSSIDDYEELVLPHGATVSFRRGGLVFTLRHGDAVEPETSPTRRERIFPICIATAVAVHLATAAAFAAMPPSSLDDEEASLDRETATYLRQKNAIFSSRILLSSPEAESDTRPDEGVRHVGSPGTTGGAAADASSARYVLPRPIETMASRLARARAELETSQYGALSSLTAALAGRGPLSFDGSLLDLPSRHPIELDGGSMGDIQRDAFGIGGLALVGNGSGGGGQHHGIGVGQVGGFGLGADPAHDESTTKATWAGCGCGSGTVDMKKYRPRIIRCALVVGVEVRGGIPPEIIRRIVRASHPRLLACYESGLERDRSLRGDVKVRFVIDSTGAVETASIDGGTMPDEGVRTCTRAVFESMSFPESERGKVLVTYPIDYDVE